MNQLIRISAEQASNDCSGSKNLVDFNIPGDNSVYDLSKSYVAIDVQSNTTPDNNSSSVLNMMIVMTTETNAGAANEAIPSPINLVKNATFVSSRQGKIDDMRKVRLFRNSLNLYKKSLAELDNSSMITEAQQYSAVPLGSLNDINTLSDKLSTKSTKEIRIPLHEVFNFGNRLYDSGKFGASKLHFELAFDEFDDFQEDFQNDGTLTSLNRAGNGLIGQFAQFTNNTGGDLALATLTTTDLFLSDSDVPFYTTQPVAMEVSLNGAANAPKIDLLIKSVTRNDNNTLTFVFNAAIATIPNGQTLDVTLFQTNSNITEKDVTLNRVELVLQRDSSAKPPSKMNYTTLMSEDDTYGAITRLSRNYHVPPACKNVYVCFSQNGISASSSNKVKSYRVTIDNEDLTGIDVTMHSPLHKELIVQTFMNNGEPIKNMLESQPLLFANKLNNTDVPQIGLDSGIIAFPVKFVNRRQTLNLSVEAITGQTLHGFHTLYYEVANQK